MNIAMALISLAGTLVPLVFGRFNPPDPERRDRREAARAKALWWSYRRRLWRVPQRGGSISRSVKIAGKLAKWGEALERLGESVQTEEALFLAQVERAKTAQQSRRDRKIAERDARRAARKE